ncbi:hypothetical protein LAZ67_11001530 [Cordylochernes scorpioides]|uniref:Uncharacterized protein n=1 Tax=Cordylochernes scorpioides TaxID=51811 RepID=A0ABY6KZ76_9ARAC|nr:hypothetical protein LAZ67_11001530 [Cordylochernes scorpioides]
MMTKHRGAIVLVDDEIAELIYSGIYRDEELMQVVEERSYLVDSKQAAVSRGRTAAYRRRRCTSWKILEGSTNFCLLFCSCFPSPCCSW